MSTEGRRYYEGGAAKLRVACELLAAAGERDLAMRVLAAASAYPQGQQGAPRRPQRRVSRHADTRAYLDALGQHYHSQRGAKA